MEDKNLKFYYQNPIGVENNKIVMVENGEGERIEIKWNLKEEDDNTESIKTCNFIVETACACRGIQGYSALNPRNTCAPPNVTNLKAIAKKISETRYAIYISWNDPKDIIENKIIYCIWEGTKVVYRTDRYPESPEDGTLLIDNTVRNAYSEESLTLTEEGEKTYYISLFPYSDKGVVNINKANRISIDLSTVTEWAEIKQYEKTLSLTYNSSFMSGASIGNYAIFAGGERWVNAAFNQSLVRYTIDALVNNRYRYRMASASIGNYALFAGGIEERTHDSRSYYVDTYDINLMHSGGSWLSTPRSDLAGVSMKEYALFAGGGNSANYYQSKVDAFNSSLVHVNASDLYIGRNSLAGALVGDYALFAGGYNGGVMNRVDVYNSTLVRSTATSLSVRRSDLSGASTGKYAIFVSEGAADIYSSSLVRTAIVSEIKGNELASTSIESYALFAGGSDFSDTVETYNINLVKSYPEKLSIGRMRSAGASVGTYSLFAGGRIDHWYHGDDVKIVDVYELV